MRGPWFKGNCQTSSLDIKVYCFTVLNENRSEWTIKKSFVVVGNL